MAKKHFDIFIIGGGINGCGIARDAAGRGYDVCLAEMDDLASGTSSWSSKLIHGGLRYLEYYEFRLVREALIERENLLQIAPHIIRPMRFILPYHKGLRPKWLLRLGLFLYDYIGGRKNLPPTSRLDLTQGVYGKPLKSHFETGFEYSDCWVDDSRLVVLNARDAAAKGADILTRHKVEKAVRHEKGWKISVKNLATGQVEIITAASVVNAAGPWVDHVMEQVFDVAELKNIRLVRGSHIVVKQQFDHKKSYILQNTDGRIIFAIPYEEKLTLIGTTDVDHKDPLIKPEISKEETDYLLEMANAYFEKKISEDDIVWTFSGVRPLYDDGASKAQEATRDYVIKNMGDNEAPLLTIFGGKITTYRKLAETVMDDLQQIWDKKRKAWTKDIALPGGEFNFTEVELKVNICLTQRPFLKRNHVNRLIRQYGLNTFIILKDVQEVADLGQHFGADLFQVEVDYLIKNEWAKSAEDILYRRTKLGLRVKDGQEKLEAYIQDQLSL